MKKFLLILTLFFLSALNANIIFTQFDVFYTGQNTNFQLLADAGTAVDLQLLNGINLDNARVVNTWSNVALNVPVSLPVPPSLKASTPTNRYYIRTVATNENPSVTSSSITVQNVKLSSNSQTTQDSYIHGDPISFHIIAENFDDVDELIAAKLHCPEISYEETIPNVRTRTLVTFTPSRLAYGPCKLEFSTSAEGYEDPADVNLTIKLPLRFDVLPDTLYNGQEFGFKILSFALSTSIASSTTVKFVCNDQVLLSWDSIPFDTVITKILPGTSETSRNCHLTTETNNNYVSDANSNQFSRALVPVHVELPENRNFIAGSSVSIKVTTPLHPSLSEDITVMFKKGLAEIGLVVLKTNAANHHHVTLSPGFLGVINVRTVGPFYMASASETFSVKAELDLSHFPKLAYTGSSVSFLILIKQFVSGGPYSVDVLIKCPNTGKPLTGTVEVGSTHLFQVPSRTIPSDLQCLVSTSEASEYFVQASAPLDVKSAVPLPHKGLHEIGEDSLKHLSKNFASGSF